MGVNGGGVNVGASSQISDGVVTNAKLLGTDLAIGASIFMFGPLYDAVVQGTWTIAQNSSQAIGFVHNQTTHNLDDEITLPVYLGVGTYSIRLFHHGDGTCGICHVAIDATEVGTVDMYHAAATYEQIGAITGISVATAGLKTLHLKMHTKNGAASQYVMFLGGIQIIRTA